MQNYYTPQEVAHILKLDISTIYRWIREGQLQAVKVGRSLRIPESELNRLLSGEEKP